MAARNRAQDNLLNGKLVPDCNGIVRPPLWSTLARTTAAVLLALLPEPAFSREPDAATGFPELTVLPTST